MTLAIFDLDNTLLNGDSDYLWGQFLGERGIVDPDEYEHENLKYYDDYRAGRLDIHAFLRFSLRPLTTLEPVQLRALQADFMAAKIEPILLPAACRLIDQHRQAGHRPLIITATNSVVTRPIATRFGISELIGTDPEEQEGRFTGEVAGIPSFREGKVQRLNLWLEAHQENLDGSFFYSDSHNDLPLLEHVAHPVAVDPDDILRGIAEQRGWPVISLRQPAQVPNLATC